MIAWLVLAVGGALIAAGAWLEHRDQRVHGYTLVAWRKPTPNNGSSSPSVYADAPSPASTPSPPSEA